MTSPEALLNKARTVYEGYHGMSMITLAELTGIPKRTLVSRRRDEGWAKLLETKNGDSTQDALQEYEFFVERAKQPIEEFFPEGEEKNKDISVLSDPVPTERDELLLRHRQEWLAPRALSAEALRIRDADPFKAMERAKLAKITAETLKISQDGERKAYGIDVGELPPGSVVVIERTA